MLNLSEILKHLFKFKKQCSYCMYLNKISIFIYNIVNDILSHNGTANGINICEHNAQTLTYTNTNVYIRFLLGKHNLHFKDADMF